MGMDCFVELLLEVSELGGVVVDLRDVEREHADCDVVEEVFHSEG
jgi:hypothetical protein